MAPVNKKFHMPSMKYFLTIKRMYDIRKEPVWVYLEREMRQNVHVKPYNEKVGIWLKFLKELRFYKHCQHANFVARIEDFYREGENRLSTSQMVTSQESENARVGFLHLRYHRCYRENRRLTPCARVS